MKQIELRLIDRELPQTWDYDEELKKALFYSVSGLKSYRSIMREHMSPGLMARVGLSMLAWRLGDQADS